MKTAKRIALGFHYSAVGMFLMFIDRNGILALCGLALLFFGLLVNMIGFFAPD